MSSRTAQNHSGGGASPVTMPHNNEVVIAVMGPTGSGKSTFINTISGSELTVGYGLRSCTASVAQSKTFDLFGRRVTLIDTPGFDDTTVSDTDVLKMIALYLSTTYEQGFKLSGIVYMHRISDFRIGGVARRNFGMFRKLCGDSSLKNVVIVTNMWSEVDPMVGAARENELATEDMFFKPAIEKGALMIRHENTVASAESILLRVIYNHPLPLRIQQELVDEGLDITETAAGEELNRQLAELQRKYKKDLEELQSRMTEALQAKDEETRKELEHVRAELVTNIKKIEHDRERLSQEYDNDKREAELRVQEIKEALQKEESIRLARDREIERLSRELETNRRTSAEEREQIMREMEMLRDANSASDSDFSDGLLGAASVVALILDVVLMTTTGLPPIMSGMVGAASRFSGS